MFSTNTTKESSFHWFLRGILILVFTILVAKVAELQIIKGNYFRSLAEGNRIRKVTLIAPRGKVLARGGEALVTSREVKKRLLFNSESGFEKSSELDGPGEIVTDWVRVYPLGAKFAHVSGYLGQISEDEVGKVNPKCPEKGPKKTQDLVGRSGLEEEYECVLGGTNGEELIEVDNMGRKVRILGKKDPIPGGDLKTNIDYGLQQKVATSLEGNKGAAIITDLEGHVLALVSSPSYDPNELLKENNSQYVSSLFNDRNLPLFNRVVGGVYHPGSVFKPLVTIAALEEGKIDKNFTFTDPGVIKVGAFSYSNWYLSQYGKTEGTIGITRAIARSTDTFFYKVGEILGPDNISIWAKKIGLDSTTGIDIPGEVSGLVPSPAWKLQYNKEPWFLGNTYHFSIGQGDLAVTPVEMNKMLLAFASSGSLCEPRIASRDDSLCKKIKISPDNFSIVKDGMTQACSGGGTGYTFFDFKPQVACKTLVNCFCNTRPQFVQA
ncbi:hypothetical protein HY045_02915 [Candidatus Woesebacteria bacterium]|nr:hypothetical protein [Candidatus Woesebacteria bacterium]